jgi:serine/threonine protein kinase/ActR/RegA family two-component response regulator
MRILVADDDAALARTLERCLRSWGYEPIIAVDGHAAWHLLKREDAPRVVVLDWDMPGLAGIDLCRMLRSTPHGADIYVLMLTARSTKADIIDALESGADDFLAKPFNIRELQLRLAKGVREAARTSPSVRRDDGATAGATLGGKFRLEKQIAKGGMGSIWLGVHLALGVSVAIKFMDPALAETAAYASFEREARAAAQLRSEHTVRIYDHGIDGQGLPYLVMEYLSGESLGETIESKGPLAPELVASLIEEASRALTEAHARGVIHRDIKPENMFLVEDSERPAGVFLKLIDFGLAHAGTSVPELPEGTIAGTPHYLSPEYMSGGTAADEFLDLWALAVTAFVAATGRVPFDGESVSEVYRHLTVDALPVPSSVREGLPPAFDAWFARACARDRSTRFQTAAELAAALTAACCGCPSVAKTKGGPVLPSDCSAPTELQIGVSGAESSK